MEIEVIMSIVYESIETKTSMMDVIRKRVAERVAAEILKDINRDLAPSNLFSDVSQ